MTRKDKRVFIRNYLGSFRKQLLAEVERMPEGWDGFELRRYISELFEFEVREMNRRRVRAYNRARASL